MIVWIYRTWLHRSDKLRVAARKYQRRKSLFCVRGPEADDEIGKLCTNFLVYALTVLKDNRREKTKQRKRKNRTRGIAPTYGGHTSRNRRQVSIRFTRRLLYSVCLFPKSPNGPLRLLYYKFFTSTKRISIPTAQTDVTCKRLYTGNVGSVLLVSGSQSGTRFIL